MRISGWSSDVCSSDLFHARGHHDMKNPHAMFKRHVQGVENVREEVRKVAEFFAWADRLWCKGVCVDSNHHAHLGRWLREQIGRASCRERVCTSVRSGVIAVT